MASGRVDTNDHAIQDADTMNNRPFDTCFHARDRVHTKNRTQVVDSRKGPAALVADSPPVFGFFVWR